MKRHFTVNASGLVLALGFIALTGLGGCGIYQSLHPPPVVRAGPTPASLPRSPALAAKSPTLKQSSVLSRASSTSQPTSNPNGNDGAAVVQVSPSPVQHSQPTPTGSAVPAPSPALPLMSPTPQPTAPSLTLSQAEWLAEANRYLDAKDYAKALPLLQQAADAGSAEAMNSLGLLYMNGWGVVQDYAKAFDGFLRAAKLGDSYAMMKVGKLYLKKGTPKDDEEGFGWLNRAYNAPKPNLEAGVFIADCYLSGKGTTQDVQKAEGIIMPLANQNVVPAMTLAGTILQYKADLKRTEAGGSTDSQIQKNLQAQANELDRNARQWWERAEKDDWNASARLGKCYEEGWCGVEKSEEEAEKRYKEGITHGNALSMLFYGLMLEKKPGRHSEAETLISRAATAGFPSASKWCKANNVNVTEVAPTDESAIPEFGDLAVLQLKPSQEIAALSVHTEPSGAAILLDGKSPQVPPNTFTHVPFGTHQLTATLDHYEPIKQDILVRKGMSPEIRLQVNPSQEIAALSVQTEPSGASILLDGKPPQSPPGTFTHVPFGVHQITATLEDYEPVKQNIEVRKGMAPELHLQLKPVEELTASDDSDKLPTFFPPRATDSVVLPFQFASKKWTLQNVAEHLGDALRNAGYWGKCSYYWLKDRHGPGFAIVTHIEHIQPDGKPVLDQRWGFELPKYGPLTLDSLLGAIMHADPGRYRLLALVVCKEPLVEQETPMTTHQVQELNAGPKWFADSPLKTVVPTEDFHLIAYVYEFERKSRSDDPALMVSSNLTAEQHLRSTALYDDIEKYLSK
jgi:TPR repeat protein